MERKKHQGHCTKCGCNLDKSNNGPNAYTEHHILPKRWFNGDGPKQLLCRTCHDVLEAIIKSAEGGKNGRKRKLTEKTYYMLNTNFLKSEYWTRE